MKKIFLIFIFLILSSSVVFLVFKNINSQKIITKFNSENNISCPQVDQYFNLQNKNKVFEKTKLLPIDTRLVFRNPSSLAINVYKFRPVFTNDSEESIKIFGLKENGFYSNSYTPMIYDVAGNQNSSTVPFTSISLNDFKFEFLKPTNVAIGIGNQWYIFNQNLCNYGSTCNQVIDKFNPTSPSIPPIAIKIPEKYSDVINSIEGYYNDNIILSLTNKTLVAYNTKTDAWENFPSNIKYSKLNSVENIMKKYGCFYYSAYQGDVVFYKHRLSSASYPDFKWLDIFYSKR